MSFLPSKSLHLGHRHSGNTDSSKGFFYFIHLERFDYSYNQSHVMYPPSSSERSNGMASIDYNTQRLAVNQ